MAFTLTGSRIRQWIPKRSRDSHKGDYGHVLIIAGSRGMSGASVLCALGALRGGAGLVTIAAPKSQQSIIAKGARPEAMTLALPETKSGAIDKSALKMTVEFISKRKITSLAIGPGLSRSPQTAQYVEALLNRLNQESTQIRGIILDADGLIALKPQGKKPSLLARLRLPMIVTPHAGEMANFFNVSSSKIQESRIQSAQKFAKLYRVIAVLKGHETIVTDGQTVYVNSTGNPGMATGGSGDVLAGLIAAFIGQTESLLSAASAGVFTHGLAGDIAGKEKTEISLIAGDIAEKIPSALKKIINYGR